MLCLFCEKLYQFRIVCEAALEDLNRAVSLSEGRGKVARQALTQRAFILRLKGQLASRRPYGGPSSNDYSKEYIIILLCCVHVMRCDIMLY